MHTYLVFHEVPSTAPLYGDYGLQTESKMRAVCLAQANNSHSACSKVSETLDLDHNKLKACLYFRKGKTDGPDTIHTLDRYKQ